MVLDWKCYWHHPILGYVCMAYYMGMFIIPES